MTEAEINTFIEEFEQYNDHWTTEKVQRVYGDKTLEYAIADRHACLNHMMNIIKTVAGL